MPKGSTPKPEAKPAETAKPKPTLPKGSTPKPKEAPKPKAAETKTAPTTLQDALENAYMDAPMTDFHQYRAKVTGYTPAPNRYFVRGTAPVGKVPTKNWNDQKATVTGYTQPSDQYFATRARIAYHPPTKRFGSFSGVAMTVDKALLQKQLLKKHHHQKFLNNHLRHKLLKVILANLNKTSYRIMNLII